MIVWFILLVVLVGIDQASKGIINAVMPITRPPTTIPVIQDFFHFTHIRNKGAVFGSDLQAFLGFSEDSQFNLYFYITAAIIATIVFGWLVIKADFKNKKLFWYLLSLLLLTAGTIGNMIDRMFQFDHAVVDFLDFRGIWQYVFNFADMCLTVGIALFMFDQFLLEPKRVKQNEQG